jgi:hypothetical protein
MTVAVQEGIRDGRFENPELMERLDVVFANRYFSALRYQTGVPRSCLSTSSRESAQSAEPMLYATLKCDNRQR